MMRAARPPSPRSPSPPVDLTRRLAPAQVDDDAASTSGAPQTVAAGNKDAEPSCTPVTLASSGTAARQPALLKGARMREQFETTYILRSITHADTWAAEAGRTVQLSMLFDQIPVPVADLSEEARSELSFQTAATPGSRVRLCDLGAVVAFLPHTLDKRPMPNHPGFPAWSTFCDPDSNAHSRNETEYVSLGQFPDSMSAEDLYWVIFLVTGVKPLSVDRLMKRGSSKVFLRCWDDALRAVRFSQTMQVTEFGTLITVLSDARADDCAAARVQLMLMRKEVDDFVKRQAARRDPYGQLHPHAQKSADAAWERVQKPRMEHEAAESALMAATSPDEIQKKQTKVEATKKALDKALRATRVIHREPADRNGLNPMTISLPEPKAAAAGRKRDRHVQGGPVISQPRRQQPVSA